MGRKILFFHVEKINRELTTKDT